MDVLAAMRDRGLSRGEYWFPYAEMKQMADPEVVARYDRGPVGIITVMPSGPPAMAGSLVQWFVYTLIVGFLCAYAGSFALGTGVGYATGFRFACTVSALAYAVSHVPDSIWKGKPWSMTMRYVFEGVVYGLVTGGTFGWLWPAGA